MKKNKLKIAYLAPEIPALSATFIYNEILQLEKKGFEVVPISMHSPGVPARGPEADRLVRKTRILYGRSAWELIKANLGGVRRTPVRYWKTFLMAMRDALHAGLWSHVGRGLVYRFMISTVLAAILTGERCRHLHVHFAHVSTDIAMYAARLAGISFSFTAHANDLFQRGWLLKEKVERADFTITISDHNRQFLTDSGAPGDRIHIVRCGVDAAFYDGCDSRTSRSFPEVGALGRMVEKKGFDTLIHACKRLKKKKTRFHLTIAGDGPLRHELEAMVVDLGLEAEIHFAGAMSHDQVSAWLKRLDLFVLPCRRDRHGDMDGIPVVLMEAMLARVPVVSTRISGIPELVVDGDTGCLSDPDDHRGVADAMQRVLTDETFAAGLVQNARQKVQTEFDLSNNVDKLATLFKERLS